MFSFLLSFFENSIDGISASESSILTLRTQRPQRLFISTVGMNEDVIREYVRKQQEEELKEEQRRLWKDNGE